MSRSKHNRLKEILIEEAVHRGEFTLSSGQKSSFYVDVRSVVLQTEGLYLIADRFYNLLPHATEVIGSNNSPGTLPVIGAMLLLNWASEIKLSGIVRRTGKIHPRKKTVEGVDVEGKRVVLIEDVVTTGKSIIRCADVIEKKGGIVTDVFAVVDRGNGEENINNAGYGFYSIFTLEDLV